MCSCGSDITYKDPKNSIHVVSHPVFVPTPDETHVYKIVMCGESGVGKSCVLARGAHLDTYNPDKGIVPRATVGAEVEDIKLDINGTLVHSRVWDTAGMEKYYSLNKSYFRGAVGAILVYDITNRESFYRLDYWRRLLLNANNFDTTDIEANDSFDSDDDNYDNDNDDFDFDKFSNQDKPKYNPGTKYEKSNISIMLVGNKIDLEKARAVTNKEGLDYAAQYGAYFMETSAFTGAGIDQAFYMLIMNIYDRIKHPINARDPDVGVLVKKNDGILKRKLLKFDTVKF